MQQDIDSATEKHTHSPKQIDDSKPKNKKYFRNMFKRFWPKKTDPAKEKNTQPLNQIDPTIELQTEPKKQIESPKGIVFTKGSAEFKPESKEILKNPSEDIDCGEITRQFVIKKGNTDITLTVNMSKCKNIHNADYYDTFQKLKKLDAQSDNPSAVARFTLLNTAEKQLGCNEKEVVYTFRLSKQSPHVERVESDFAPKKSNRSRRHPDSSLQKMEDAVVPSSNSKENISGMMIGQETTGCDTIVNEAHSNKKEETKNLQIRDRKTVSQKSSDTRRHLGSSVQSREDLIGQYKSENMDLISFLIVGFEKLPKLKGIFFDKVAKIKYFISELLAKYRDTNTRAADKTTMRRTSYEGDKSETILSDTKQESDNSIKQVDEISFDHDSKFVDEQTFGCFKQVEKLSSNLREYACSAPDLSLPFTVCYDCCCSVTNACRNSFAELLSLEEEDLRQKIGTVFIIALLFLNIAIVVSIFYS